MPKIKRILPPIKVDILPYFWFRIFPKFSPNNVKMKLVTENINDDNKYLLVIAGRPTPVVRLSILTDNPNNKYPGILSKNFSSLFLKLDMIISIDIRDNIIPTKIFVFSMILLVIKEPILSPINGIIKW